MDFVLHANEALMDAFKRVVTEQAALAQSELQRPTRERAAGILEARRSLKRLRSALYLARGLDRPTRRALDRQARDANRILSAQRDADALVESCDALLGDLRGQERQARTLQEVRRRLAGTRMAHDLEGHRGTAVVRTAEAAVADLGTALAGLWPGQPDPGAIGEILRRLIRKGRRAMRAARKRVRPEVFHEWRKLAKHTWHVAWLLSEVWPEQGPAIAAGFKRLATALGRANDVGALRQWLRAQAPSEATVDLAEWLEGQEMRLRKQALKLGAEAYRNPVRGLKKSLCAVWPATMRACQRFGD